MSKIVDPNNSLIYKCSCRHDAVVLANFVYFQVLFVYKSCENSLRWLSSWFDQIRCKLWKTIVWLTAQIHMLTWWVDTILTCENEVTYWNLTRNRTFNLKPSFLENVQSLKAVFGKYLAAKCKWMFTLQRDCINKSVSAKKNRINFSLQPRIHVVKKQNQHEWCRIWDFKIIKSLWQKKLNT